MTGAEALQKIMDTVEQLTATVNELKVSIQLIEANIKVLNNRAAGLMKNQSMEAANVVVSPANPTPNVAFGGLTAGPPMPKPQQSQVLQAGTLSRGRQMVEAPQEQRDEAMNFIREENGQGVLTYKKVFGKLVNNTNDPIENVLIKVYDKNNEVCASTETDPIGYWETMLKPGRYVAEYTKSGFKTANKTFEVGKGAKEVEVK